MLAELSPLPADLDAIGRSDRLTQEAQQMIGRAAVLADHIERIDRDVVVLVFARLLFERVDQDFQILLGDFAEQRIRICVVEIKHLFVLFERRVAFTLVRLAALLFLIFVFARFTAVGCCG